MAAVHPRSTRRAGRVGLVGLVALAHVAAFLVASLSLPKEPPSRTEPTPLTFAAALPFAPPKPPLRLSPRAQPRTAREKREAKRKSALAAGPSAPAAPAAAPGWTLPAPGSQGPTASELADPYAVREALRGSVGCDMETLKLRPDEQARCADRTAKWAKKGRQIGPAEDDPKRAAELAAEEDYARRRHEWKTTNCGIGVGGDAKSTLGQMPPRRGQPKDGEDEARANAC